ncbi:UNVERIFIED_CONTAM: hypothetical protein HDU68_000931 [Siphonaria sp. JEL0065]|nr:hypothetical protein HDU68_000931 [Siphonaria sp. JEL0065]
MPVPAISRSKKPVLSLSSSPSHSSQTTQTPETFDDFSHLKTTLEFAIANANKALAVHYFRKLMQLCKTEKRTLEFGAGLLHNLIALLGSEADVSLGPAKLREALAIVDNAFRFLPTSEVTEDDLNTLLKLLDLLNYADRFSALWNEVVEATQQRGLAAPELSLNTYNLVLGFFGRSGLADDANATFQLLMEVSTPKPLASGESTVPFTQPPDEVSYFNVINSHCTQSPPDLTGALSHFEQMTINSTPPPTLPIFNLLIQAAGKIKDFETASLLVDTLEPAGLYPNHFTYNILIDAYSKVGNVDAAHELLKKWNNDTVERNSDPRKPNLAAPTIVTFNTLMTLCSRHGGTPEEADALLESMVRSVGVNKITVTAYMDVFKRRGEYEACRKAFDMFEKELNVPKFTEGYNVLLSCFGFVKNVKAMEEIYDEMIANRCKPTLVTFRIMLNAYGMVLDVNALEKWVTEMERHGFYLDIPMQEMICKTLVIVAKLSPEEKVVLPSLERYLSQSRIKSTLIFNSVLEAHLHDHFITNKGSAFDLMGILASVDFAALFSTENKVKLIPNYYTLVVLLNAVEKALLQRTEIVDKRGTAQVLLRLHTSLRERGVDLRKDVESQLSRVVQTLQQ